MGNNMSQQSLADITEALNAFPIGFMANERDAHEENERHPISCGSTSIDQRTFSPLARQQAMPTTPLKSVVSVLIVRVSQK